MSDNDARVHYPMMIGGRKVEAADGRIFDSIDPFSGQAWATAPDADTVDVDLAVKAARVALDGTWGEMSGSNRARLLRKLGDILARDAHVLAEFETRDSGKLFRDSKGQTEYIPEWFYFFAGLADKLNGETSSPGDGRYLAYTRHEPIGVVAGIIPWNAPLMLLTWKLAPALAAGCTFVAKPSDYTPVSILELAERIDEAGIPSGVFNVVTGFGPAVGKALVAHAGVDKVAFTGSTGVGIEVARSAANHLAEVSLELGGKSAQVVFADADLEAVSYGVVAGVFAATGQTCMAGSRLLIEDSIYDEVMERVVNLAGKIRVGDPSDPATEMGPLATNSHFEKVLGFIDRARMEGASVLCGGGAVPGRRGGYLVQPTVLGDVTPEMEIFREEVFGPVVGTMRFHSEAEAIALANESSYGLAGAVWTNNVRRAHRVAHALKAGTVWINTYRVIAPGVPFGGFKMSGLGRESGIQAIYSYTQTKAVWVDLTGGFRDPFKIG